MARYNDQPLVEQLIGHCSDGRQSFVASVRARNLSMMPLSSR